MNVACSAKRKELQPGKNTNCGARINFRLETPVAKNTEQRIDKENFPLWLKIDFSHNHSLQRAEFLKYRSVNEDTKAAFSAMYQEGFTPSTAHKEMKRQIREEYPESWPQKFADKSKLPSIFWCYFDEKCKKEFPLPDGECYAKIAQSGQGQTVVAIVDPFMRRVHQVIPQSGELIFMDATSNLDRNDTSSVPVS